MIRVRAVVILTAWAVTATVAVTTACKGKDAPPKQPPRDPVPAPADAAVTADPWAACDAALAAAATLPPSKRAMAIIDGCEVCGDWRPILDWQRLPSEGGPPHKAIEAAMTACDAWCEPTAKQHFLGALDDARAKQTRAPWRALGEVCKDKVSAVPDARFMTPPYFALDRIARAAATRPDSAKLLAAIAIPLPAVTISGVGVALPEAPVSRPELVAGQLTVTVGEVTASSLPVAKLGAEGLTVTGGPYPGNAIPLTEVAAAVGKLGGRAALFAPAGMTAARLVQVAAAAGPHTLVLAATTRTAPPGWSMYGVIPVAIRSTIDKAGVVIEVGASTDAAIRAIKAAAPAALKQAPVTLRVGSDATVANLATVLGALAFLEVPAAALAPAAAR